MTALIELFVRTGRKLQKRSNRIRHFAWICFFALAASPSSAQRIIPETSASGAVTVDGLLNEATWANALTLELYDDLYYQASQGTQHWAYAPPYNAADFTGEIKVMYQGQKFYIASIVTADNQSPASYLAPQDMSTIPEFLALRTAVQMWQAQFWQGDGLELFMNLTKGPEDIGLATMTASPDGYLQMKVLPDKNVVPANKPAGAADRFWDMIAANTTSINAQAWGSADFAAGPPLTIELCIDADQVPALTLTAGNSMSLLVHYHDADINTNSSAHGVEPPPAGLTTAYPLNNTRFLNVNKPLNNFQTPGNQRSPIDWEELKFGAVAAVEDWKSMN